MKISKVNHVKTGVSAKPATEGGMLYDYPNQQRGSKDLRKHIKEVNQRAQKLYGVFVPLKDKDSKKEIKNARSTAESYIKFVLVSGMKRGASQEEAYGNILRAGQKSLVLGKTKMGEPFKKQISSLHVTMQGKTPYQTAEYIVANYLRNSLAQKKNVASTMVAVLAALFDGANYDRLLGEIAQEDVKELISAVYEDYSKEEQLEKIADSIEKQRVPVQIAEDGKYLIPSGANHEKKAYIFNFMRAYAGADDNGQAKMLNHMKDMICHFYTQEEFISEEILDLINKRETTPYKEKEVIRTLNATIAEKVSGFIVSRYQETLREFHSKDDEGWVRYISDKAEKLLSARKLTQEKIRCDYLFKKTWEEWNSYVAKKYIDFGKAVYNFAMEDAERVENKESVSIGVVSETYRDGISSFSYERMKAEDSLSRAMIHYVLFAVNNFDQSVRDADQRGKGKEDILNTKSAEIKMYEDTSKRILRYFGGLSKFENSPVSKIDKRELVDVIKDEMAISRNSAFHYVTGAATDKEKPVVAQLLDTELASVGEIYRKKYYSNNVPMFYQEKDIDALMTRLYKEKKVSPAQIPSFNKVLSRNVVAGFVTDYLREEAKRTVADPEISEKYRSSFYFLLKEIYYYDFLLKQDLMERFKKGLETVRREKDTKEFAYRDFTNRVNKLSTSNLSFGEFCQEIMTEYNQQNGQKEKKPSTVEDREQIYKHYRTFLYKGIREAFLAYLREEKALEFLCKPEDRRKIFADMSEEQFNKAWNTECYEYLREDIGQNALLSGWYITAHFMTPKHVNHLGGEIKNYIRFIQDIEKRAAATGNLCVDNTEKVKVYTKLLEVLEFCKMFCGQVSNKMDDYFASEEEYAKYISGFVDFGGKSTALLQAFCNEHEELNYYDAKNPVPNRNLILSTMYGNKKILSRTMEKVTEDELSCYRKNKEKLGGVFKRGVCSNAEEHKLMRAYQNQKNRIEFVDVLTMTEMLNDLYGQLISYAYLRERDLMFMQLGFYYTKLYYTESVPADSKLRVLSGECDIRDGAILYQIAAMYSYDKPIFAVSEEGVASRKDSNISIGGKIKEFINEYCGGSDIYENGLCFFEDVQKRHTEYVDLRNYIDHFKYFANQNRSILDLYSSMYNGFFSYDTKLKKSISFVLPNILLSYFVNAKLSFDGTTVQKDGKVYNQVQIAVDEKKVQADCFTYKVKQDEKELELKIPARDEIFLREVVKMISYKK